MLEFIGMVSPVLLGTVRTPVMPLARTRTAYPMRNAPSVRTHEKPSGVGPGPEPTQPSVRSQTWPLPQSELSAAWRHVVPSQKSRVQATPSSPLPVHVTGGGVPTQPALSCAGSLGRQNRPAPQRSSRGTSTMHIVVASQTSSVQEKVSALPVQLGAGPVPG